MRKYVHAQMCTRAKLCMCETAHVQTVLSSNLVPRPANFLQRMLDEKEGSGKDRFFGDPDWLSEMQYNTISPLFADY